MKIRTDKELINILAMHRCQHHNNRYTGANITVYDNAIDDIFEIKKKVAKYSSHGEHLCYIATRGNELSIDAFKGRYLFVIIDTNHWIDRYIAFDIANKSNHKLKHADISGDGTILLVFKKWQYANDWA